MIPHTPDYSLRSETDQFDWLIIDCVVTGSAYILYNEVCSTSKKQAFQNFYNKLLFLCVQFRRVSLLLITELNHSEYYYNQLNPLNTLPFLLISWDACCCNFLPCFQNSNLLYPKVNIPKLISTSMFLYLAVFRIEIMSDVQLLQG